MRIVAAVLVVGSLPASAAPCSTSDADPALPPCERLHAFHELDVSAAAGATTAAAGDGARTTESARVDASYALGFGHDIPAYSLELSGGLTASRSDGGGVHAWGAGTRLSLTAGPTMPPVDAAHVGRGAMAPLPIEISHEGELAALPSLDAAPDVARAQYTSEHVEARTSMLRAIVIDRDPEHGPSSLSFDLSVFYGALDATMQDTTRLAGQWGWVFGQFGVLNDTATIQLLAADDHVVAAGDASYDWLEVWPLRIEMRSPQTGTQLELGWASVSGFPWPGAPGDHRDRDLVSIGLGDLRGRSIGYRRRPYIAMSGLPAFEDRAYAEDIVGGPYHLAARAFVARTDRATAPTSDTVAWTAGIEGDGSRRVGPFDVGMRAELGRSYYASLDDAAPSPGFGARGAVTVSRAVKRRYFRASVDSKILSAERGTKPWNSSPDGSR